MEPQRHVANILDLSNELLCDILERIEADPDKLVSLDRRAYLSVESFSQPPRQLPNSQQTIGNFRLACRRFSELGAMYQLPRVTTRFSQKGLSRLDRIAGQPHLARHVKKFCYMVPYFYVEGRERVREVIPTLPTHILGPHSLHHFISKVSEQKRILATGFDSAVLGRAIRAFTSLQHVQILRVQDEEDGALLQYIRQQPHLTQFVELNWTPACSHCTKTVGTALMASGSPCTQFSSPMLSPQSAFLLAEAPSEGFAPLAERLTCLTVHFDDPYDLDVKMRELSGLFKTVFEAARNMQAVHVGFPSHRPLTLRLEQIFHNVRWEKLLAFGIQAWKLDAQEIIELASRHRDRLKGLRLRDVLLKEGSKWKDVLGWLRDNMPRLDWVSLRRIGYAKHFDEQWAVAGVEVPDDPPGGASDSDSDDDDIDLLDVTDDNDTDTPTPNDEETSSSDDFDRHSNSEASEDSNLGPPAYDIDFPPMSPDTPSTVPWCNCNLNGDGRRVYPDTAEDLGDNGTFVTNQQRKQWENWVVRRCPEHSSK
ncbi:hypothetical protein NA57DRAFT_31962 [Rhizodiscina lignyota]|uniref:Uncharacterized protein n=1 Tax=Rhizodiscina lignyota TaxID=1504668 RepID=A0A9P4IN56_9PEZI|nr:hypothetical protein NA57DRAFT_31962 [Rhizodiscina lignyota]